VTAASALQLRPCSSEALGLLGTLTRCWSWVPCLLVTLARTCRTACTCLTSAPSRQPARPCQLGCPAACNPRL